MKTFYRELLGGLILLAMGALFGYCISHLLYPTIVNVNKASNIIYPTCIGLHINTSGEYSFMGLNVSEGIITPEENHTFPEGTSGEAFLMDGGKTIWISDNMSFVRKLDTLAHEYGHRIQMDSGWVAYGGKMNEPYWQSNATEEGAKFVLEYLINRS